MAAEIYILHGNAEGLARKRDENRENFARIGRNGRGAAPNPSTGRRRGAQKASVRGRLCSLRGRSPLRSDVGEPFNCESHRIFRGLILMNLYAFILLRDLCREILNFRFATKDRFLTEQNLSHFMCTYLLGYNKFFLYGAVRSRSERCKAKARTKKSGSSRV